MNKKLSEAEKQRELILLENIRHELKAIVERGLDELQKQEEYMKELPEAAKKKMEDLIESYKDVEKVIAKLGALSIVGLTSKTAKVVSVNSGILPSMTGEITSVGNNPRVSVNSNDVFWRHPTGPEFELEPGKKYRLLVAFVREEE